MIYCSLPSTPSAFDLFLNVSCPGTEMTLADLACYAELGQLLPQYHNLWDFGPNPNVQKWCSRMAAVPYHEDVMLSSKLLGDGSALLASGQPFAKEMMVMANKEVLPLATAFPSTSPCAIALMPSFPPPWPFLTPGAPGGSGHQALHTSSGQDDRQPVTADT